MSMSTTYQAIHLVGKGGLDKLVPVTLPLSDPSPGELRVRVRATGVGYTDVIMRRGYYPYRPSFPFAPGYEVVGVVDAIGPGVKGFAIGDRVAALTVHGGYAESLTRRAADFVKLPPGDNDAEVAAVILNYVTAYQMIHRAASLKAGQTALVTGANGGVGLALLELLRAIGVRAIGAASKRHHALLTERGATPIESRGSTLHEQVRAIVPEGVDASFDAIGGASASQCVKATRRGGVFVCYGFTAGVDSHWATIRGAWAAFVGAPLTGRRSTFYGITKLYREDPKPFHEDLPKVLDLLDKGAIAPRIAERLSLLEGARAQEMLEKGGVAGKIVLVAQGAH